MRNNRVTIKAEDIENTVFNFRGNKLDAVKGEFTSECDGCALIDKDCYNNANIKFACRRGYIFKKHETKKNK